FVAVKERLGQVFADLYRRYLRQLFALSRDQRKLVWRPTGPIAALAFWPWLQILSVAPLFFSGVTLRRLSLFVGAVLSAVFTTHDDLSLLPNACMSRPGSTASTGCGK